MDPGDTRIGVDGRPIYCLLWDFRFFFCADYFDVRFLFFCNSRLQCNTNATLTGCRCAWLSLTWGVLQCSRWWRRSSEWLCVWLARRRRRQRVLSLSSRLILRPEDTLSRPAFFKKLVFFFWKRFSLAVIIPALFLSMLGECQFFF